jgi:DNA-binding NarL/FixJ family response regulator
VVRVVIADDDETYLDSLRGVIEAQSGLEVVGSARDGIEAIELTELLDPDALVIDPHMPRLDGLAAIARLRRDYPSLCLIALTGDPAPTIHQAAAAAGADGVFLKGEYLEKLLSRLAAVNGA